MKLRFLTYEGLFVRKLPNLANLHALLSIITFYFDTHYKDGIVRVRGSYVARNWPGPFIHLTARAFMIVVVVVVVVGRHYHSHYRHHVRKRCLLSSSTSG